MKLIAFLLASALIISACGGSSAVETGGAAPTPTTSSPTDVNLTGAVMAAAFSRLVNEAGTFGPGGPSSTEYLVQTRLDPAAGDATGSVTDSRRPLTGPERTAIEDTLVAFGTVRWIDDPAAWRTAQLTPVIPGSMILGVGEPVIDGDTALVPMSLWCGGLCGTWLTYRVANVDGSWTVTGTEGPIAVS